jgi:PKD repeat protein
MKNNFLSLVRMTVLTASLWISPQALSAQQNPCTAPPNCIINNDVVVANFGDLNTDPGTTAAGWYGSHGSPTIFPNGCPTSANNRSLWMWSYGGTGEGVFTCYNFQAGQTYRICYWVRNTNAQANGNLNVLAKNGLTSIVDGPLWIPSLQNSQMIDNGFVHNQQWVQRVILFTPNANYAQLWFYPFMQAPVTNSANQYELQIDDIRITQLTTPATVSANPASINWCATSTLSVSGLLAGAVVTWAPATGLNTTSGATVVASPCITTTYTATITNPNCLSCGNNPQQQQLFQQVVVLTDPLLISGTLTPTCGQALNLTAVAPGNCNNVSYVWTGPAGFSATGASISISNVNPLNTGVYSVTATPAQGCVRTQSVNVTVGNCACLSNPDFTWNSYAPTFFYGTNVTSSTPLSWFWDFGDGFTSTLQNPIHGYSSPGVYTVCLTSVAINSFGETCSNQICKQVSYFPPPPNCTIHADFAAYILGCQVHFSDISSFTNGEKCFFRIDYGDGITETGTNHWFNHGYSEAGYYDVCFTTEICENNGTGRCIDIKCATIYVPCWGIRTGQFATDTATASEQVQLYPNPASSVLNIALPEGISGRVSIVDVSGRQVAEAVATGATTWTADLTNLAAGVYAVTVVGADGVTHSGKFVKE